MIREKHKINEEIFEATCDYCGLTWEYTEDSVRPLYWGKGFTCPHCGEDIVVEEPKLYTFPEGFFHTYKGKDGVYPVAKTEIQSRIEVVKKNLVNSNKSYDFETIQSGDTVVIGLKSDEEITIYVAQDFYEMSSTLNLD